MSEAELKEAIETEDGVLEGGGRLIDVEEPVTDTDGGLLMELEEAEKGIEEELLVEVKELEFESERGLLKEDTERDWFRGEGLLTDTKETLLSDTHDILLAEAKELKAEADLFKGDPFLAEDEEQLLNDTEDKLLTEARELDSLTGVHNSEVSTGWCGAKTELEVVFKWEAQPELLIEDEEPHTAAEAWLMKEVEALMDPDSRDTDDPAGGELMERVEVYGGEVT